MVFAIKAYENRYGGLHGIYDLDIVYSDDITSVEEYAEHMSRELINSDIYDEIVNEAEAEGCAKDTEEFEYYIEQAVNEDIAYNIWEIVDPYEYYSMCSDFANAPNTFIKNHCKEL